MDLKVAGNDLTIKTNEQGRAIVLFIGKRLESGKIRGRRYARRLAYDRQGRPLKDHWEEKGSCN